MPPRKAKVDVVDPKTKVNNVDPKTKAKVDPKTKAKVDAVDPKPTKKVKLDNTAT